MEEVLVERAARALWAIANRVHDGELAPLTGWAPLAPSVKERYRSVARARLSRLRASGLISPAPPPPSEG